MVREYLNTEATNMRRSDRAVEDETWIKQFLAYAALGTLATVHDEQAFINQNLFVYDEAEHCIYIHTADKGRTRANVEQHEKVCFSIMEMGRLLPADEALEFSVEYAGVIIFGKSKIVEDEEQATHALQLLLDKYSPHLTAGNDYRPPTPEELKRTAVFRISIDNMSAKKKEVEAFEGAHWYPEQPILQSVKTRSVWQGSLQGIFIAPKESAEIQSVDSVEVVKGKGLKGDRYYLENLPEKYEAGREVTLISLEAIEAVNLEKNIPLTPEQSRRNLLTVAVPLNHLVGKRFRIGEVVLEGKLLCEPCSSLAKITGYGKPLTIALLHRGGLRADIIEGGEIHVGDMISAVIEPETV
jgi:uncharacterized protein